ncbi:hypothetical protein [Aquabacterium sp.]|uniref:hypothetical protein n=1 Tax=Aquabacterium sp. TaxID=1872578 RepID=UPI004037E30F
MEDEGEPVNHAGLTRGHTPEGDINVPTVDDRPGLVEASELRKRLESVQGSIQKSVLALLAIVAFWLSIENSYHNYAALMDLRQKQTFLSEKLRQSEIEILKLKARKAGLQPAVDAQASAASAPAKDSAPDALAAAMRSLGVAQDRRDGFESGRDAVRDRAKKLQQESLELSVLGTKIASRLVLAPMVCLVAFLFWLNYFSARRAMAHALIAALHLQLGASQRHFGAATSGTMWLTPLPVQVRIQRGGDRVHYAGRADLRWLLGWSALAEGRQVRAMRTFALVCAAAVLRIGFIAIDLTSTAAVEENFISAGWRWPAALTAGTLTIVCLVKLVFLTRAGTDDVEGAQVPLPDRRELVATALVVASVGLATAYVNRLALGSAGTSALNALTGRDRQRRSAGLRPRFVSMATRAKRQAHRHIVRVVLPLKSAFVFSPPRRERTFSIHSADPQGKVRLRSAAAAAPKFVESTVAMMEGWLQAPPARRQLNPRRTWPFEARAMDLLEQGKIADACDVLLLGVRLTLRSGVADPINIRLLDLLAGLAVRSNAEARYLAPMLKEVTQFIDRAGKSGILQAAPDATVADAARGSGQSARQVGRTLAALEARILKWRQQGGKEALSSGQWRTRWSAAANPKPVWWHHPFELRTAPLPALRAATTTRAGSQPAASMPHRAVPGEVHGKATQRQASGAPANREQDAKRRQRPVRIP